MSWRLTAHGRHHPGLILFAVVMAAACVPNSLYDPETPEPPVALGKNDGTAVVADGSAQQADLAGRADLGTLPLRVAVISDLNGAYGSTSYEASVHGAVARIIVLRPDLVLSTGDMVAGQKAGLDYRAMWAGFHAAVSNPLKAAGIPFAVAPGNHDASAYSGFAAERAEYLAQWNARRPALPFVDASGYPWRYSFTLGPALFVSLDDTTIGPLDAAQRGWVAQQLSLGATAPVKIVFGHVPIRPFTQGRETEILGDNSLENVLTQGSATLFLSGHHHGYYPGRRGALRHVSAPCLGSGSRKLVGSNVVSPRGFILLTAKPDGAVELDAYAEPNFQSPIARTTLPAAINPAPHTVTRDDL